MSQMKSEEKKRDYVVYKIVLEDGYEYVGSTSDLNRRIRHHFSDCDNQNGKSYNVPLYKHIRSNNLKFDKDNFIVLEHFQNITETQARIIEERYRKESELQGGNILNACRAYVTEEETKQDKKEWHKEYRIENRDILLENNREYRIKNRDKILKKNQEYYIENKKKISEKNKQTYTCACGISCTIRNKARHERSQHHKKYFQIYS